jgi:hypothetical protein
MRGRVDSRAPSVMKGIACRVGKADVGLPVGAVGQIIEYPVFPLPLARPYVAGLGLHDDWPLISLHLHRTDARAAGAEPRLAKGVLLDAGHGGDGGDTGVRWALEVTELGSFVEVTPTGRAPAPALDLPPWISQASTRDGRTLAWIDVGAMLEELAAALPVG